MGTCEFYSQTRGISASVVSERGRQAHSHSKVKSVSKQPDLFLDKSTLVAAVTSERRN